MKKAAVHLLALWTVLCCCQWRAVAASLGVQGMPSCCLVPEGGTGEATGCCADRSTPPACCAESQEPCCKDSESPAEPSGPGKGRCTGCCEKAPPPPNDDPLLGAFDAFVNQLGSLLLVSIEPAAPVIDQAIDRCSVWHPPPGRLRPLLCILTV